ncbi:F-box only protein 36-like [Pseudonaja textilis]|uniref:F-box only protein 36-like n=1 Tax=Pseudonaja textilis TaxID=8673 RepID=UPI000EA9F21F|nr:F-box only protein 36-like [Pseudonaja textilis]
MSSLLQEKLCEIQIQAPAPQKDFHYFTITKTEVIWRSWQITYRPNQEKIFPKELKKTHRDFLLDEQLHKQVQSIFGKSMLKYTLSLCQGHYDFLVRMPENLIIYIMSFLNVKDIEHLSKTCKKFQQLCNTDEFWERIKKLQNNFTLDLQSTKILAYEKQRNFHQRKGYLTQMQRRHTTFF